MTWIKTYTNKKFDFANPSVDQIDIEDIAHGLSRQCLFAGQSKEFCSVAQHAVLCAKWVLSVTNDVDSAKYVLLHAASVAYCGNLSRPLKGLLSNYNMLEQMCNNVIHAKFDLNTPQKYSSLISEIEDRMLVTEANFLLPEGSKGFSVTAEPIDGLLTESWSSDRAKNEYMKLYLILFTDQLESTV